MATNIPTADRVARARVRLLTQVAPFYGMILMRLNIEPSTRNNTAWTDGRSIGYCPAFVDTLSDDQLSTLLAHKAAHVAHGHPFRLRPQHDRTRANIAMDHAINLSLADYKDTTGRKPFSLPPGACADMQYTGMAWEDIYPRLPPGQSGDGEGDVYPYPAESPADLQEAEAANIQAVTQAAQAAKAYGQLPGDIARMVESMRKPAVDWTAALRNFLQRSRHESTWKTPRRRALAAGMYLPSRSGEQCPPLAVVIDTSGSINDATLAAFQSEINAIFADVRPQLVTVIYCDARVKGTEEYTPEDLPLTLHPVGGGGTQFAPAFDWVAENMEPPAALVYLTDLAGPAPTDTPEYPVLWVSTDKRADSMPFGERIDLPPIL